MSSTFDGLRIAQRGVQAARVNLNITGQNISNVNTYGYTRQRVKQTSIAPTSINMLYGTTGAVVGEGTETTSTEQLRDTFLDAQYRLQNASTQDTAAQLSALKDIENALYTTDASDHKTIVDALGTEFGSFISQLESLTTSGSTSNENLVKEQAKLLATRFNTIANDVDNEWSLQRGYLNKYGVTAANDLLKNIASLSDQIRDADLAGSPALELMDDRNNKIDELSQYINVTVTETPTPVGAGRTIDILSIQLADNDGKPITYTDDDSNPQTCQLVNGNEYAKFSTEDTTKTLGQPYDHVDLHLSQLSKDGTGTVIPEVTNSDFKGGEFNGYLKLLNESGEFDTAAGGITTTARGIGYYAQILNTVAQKFANTLNAANSTNADGTINKPLFTASDGITTTGITAGNIRIATAWKLTMAKDTPNPGDDSSTSFSNITKMISELKDKESSLETGNNIKLFTGTIQKSITNIGTSLGQEIKSIDDVNTTQTKMLDKIDGRRKEISSVDVDEETVNLISFNHSLTASARFMTTVDECLNTIINKMGIAGMA